MRIPRRRRARNFPAASDAPARREQVIATGRVLLAGGALTAEFLGPAIPGPNHEVIVALLVGYLVLSVALWLILRAWPTKDPAILIGAHSADLLCTTALTVLYRGPNSPFFLFFIFVLLAGAYRWGFRGAMATAAAGVVLLTGEAYALSPASLPSRLLDVAGLRMAREFVIGRLALQSAYLLIIGLLLGYLAEGEAALQSEAATTAHIVGKARVGGGIKETLEGMFRETMAAFGAARGMIVVEAVEDGGLFVWEARRLRQTGRIDVSVDKVERSRRTAYLPGGGANGWFALKRRDGSYRLTELEPATPALAKPGGLSTVMPEALLGSQTVLAAAFRLGRQWQGWVYLLDAGWPSRWRKDLRFLARIVEAAAPAAYSTYLLSRMREQIGEQERGRVARELHDGAIQSLVSAELQMHAMRRRPDRRGAALPDVLEGVERLIHEQVLNLRELMEKIRPIDADPRSLPETLAEQVEKFQRETGIAATFTAEPRPVRLTGRASRELARILQELLFNVRRHSGAGKVDVRLGSCDGLCRLEVADDGCGFDFSGRYGHEALEQMRKGPRVVRERLRMLNGRLEIESYPGRGARLEISLPQGEE